MPKHSRAFYTDHTFPPKYSRNISYLMKYQREFHSLSRKENKMFLAVTSDCEVEILIAADIISSVPY